MRQYAYIMDHTLDIHLARKETALIALVFAVFACAAQLVEDPRLKGEREDDGGMGSEDCRRPCWEYWEDCPGCGNGREPVVC